MRRLLTVTLMLSTLLVPAGAAFASEVVDTSLVSHRYPDALSGNGASYAPAISADGSIIAFESAASDLVPGDTNGQTDVFAYDTATGTITRVSVASDETQGNGASLSPVVSADGATIAYYSWASTLVPGDGNGVPDVFVYDLATGTTTRVSVADDSTEGNSNSYYPAISADGAIVAFESDATNLVPGDTNGAEDVFVHDVAAGTNTRVSVASDGTQGNLHSFSAAISADATTVSYVSWATNLVPGDSNGRSDVFVHDVAGGTTTRVSVADGGTESNNHSFDPAISADGTVISFMSWATNLVPGDSNGTADIFVYAAGATTRVSVAGDGSESDGDSYAPTISADGTIVAFESDAASLVPSDTNGASDVFVRDVTMGTTTRVSVAGGGSESDGTSYLPAISADGTAITYESSATNLVAGDGNGASDVFLTAINDAPVADDLITTTPEDTPIGTELGVVTATDRNDDELTFTIMAGDGALFDIDNHGVVTVAGSLDHETATSHAFTVTVSDGHATDTATVTIAVGDVNEAPSAVDLAATVAEDAPIGTELGTVTATDPDDDPLSFEITAGNEDGRFAVDAAGLVTLAGALDYETAAGYELAVTVSDGELSDIAAVTVTVTDIDEIDPDYDPFVDDDGSVFEDDIEWLESNGITKGCNPPTNDRYCPSAQVTRGQVAAFLMRALGLPASSADYFEDDDGSIYEDAINRLAAAGITKGCNPAEGNTHFCPADYVTRGQVAALLVRALSLPATGEDFFADDDGSIFEDAINRLAVAGVTKGCNPPTNDRYCPAGYVTRGQVAAFLHRALN